jgi:nicotinamidase-related amidase
MTMADTQGPNKPEPRALHLDRAKTALLVLDLNARCQDPAEICSELMEPLGEFLERVRAASIPIVYTVSLMFKGTPLGEVAAPLNRRDTEPVLHPDSFDKFAGGELRRILDEHNVENLIVVGSLTNVAVLYTSTSAARVHRYNVIIPLDGVNAKTEYEHEYAIHQLSILPAGAGDRMQFTNLSMIEFV